MAVLAYKGLTDVGRMLLSHVQNGAVLVPTRIVMGSGSMPGSTSVAGMTAVVTPVLELSVSKKKRYNDGKCVFGGVYQNSDITTAFYYREIALFCRAEYRDADGNVTQTVAECLYVYGNFGSNADLLPAYSTGTVVERNIDLVVYVGGTNTQVDLTVESGSWVTHEALQLLDEKKVNKSGDTMTGNLIMERAAFPQFIVRDTTQRRDGFLQYAEDGLLFMQNIPLNGDGYDRSILILGNENTPMEDLLRVARVNNGSWNTSRVYHEGNKPAAGEIGAASSGVGQILYSNLLTWAIERPTSTAFYTSPLVTNEGLPVSNQWYTGWLSVADGGVRLLSVVSNETGVMYTNVTINGAWTGWVEHFGTKTGFKDLVAADINTITVPGVYWCSNDCTNSPFPGHHGFLEVSGRLQRFTKYPSGEVASRMYVNGLWSPWGLPITDDYIRYVTTGVATAVVG